MCLIALALILTTTACSAQDMLRYHRARNPDGPYQHALCQSPEEHPSGRWYCSAAKVDALRREARQLTAKAHAYLRATHIPYEANWDRVAQCESGGNWAINTGNGYYGGVQFSLPTWRSVGGTGYPHQHSKAEQVQRAEILRQRSGLGQWPVCGQRWHG